MKNIKTLVASFVIFMMLTATVYAGDHSQPYKGKALPTHDMIRNALGAKRVDFFVVSTMKHRDNLYTVYFIGKRRHIKDRLFSQELIRMDNYQWLLNKILVLK